VTLARRLRGIAGTALAWATGWGIAGTVFGAALLATEPALRSSLRAITMVLLGSIVGWAVTGAVAGVLFATVLLMAERRRTLQDLLPRRIAAWGALGGALLPLVGAALTASISGPIAAGRGAMTVALGALLGGSCAFLSLKLARRAILEPDRDPAAGQLGSGATPAEHLQPRSHEEVGFKPRRRG
jgi:hypothetical protein